MASWMRFSTAGSFHDLRNSLSMAIRSSLGGWGVFLISGNWSYVLPFNLRPATFFRTPPHCLKKKGTDAFLHCDLTDSTHLRSMGRAPGPLSPPTITQCSPSRLIDPRSSSKGSTDKNRTAPMDSRRSVILGRPYFLSSTL